MEKKVKQKRKKKRLTYPCCNWRNSREEESLWPEQTRETIKRLWFQ